MSVAMVGLTLLAALTPAAGAAFVGATGSQGNTFAASNTFSSIRVVTYQVNAGAFTGARYTLTLDQALQPNYFVMIRGGAGTGTSSGNRGPDANFARVSGDPFGNFGTATAANQLRLERRGTTGDWQGQVVVVESVRDEATSGFRLLDVVERSMGPGVTNAASTSATAWASISQVGLYGGQYGGGVDATATSLGDHQTGWARIFPSGANVVNYVRQAGGGGSLAGTSRFTTYVVEWGSEWTIQRATVSGSNGGDGVDAAGEYNTAPIAPVRRDRTFVVAFGHTELNRLSSGWEGQVFTLGNGVVQNPVENRVAVGAETAAGRTAEVYVHTHPRLTVDYRFGPDGSIATMAISGAQTVDPTIDAEAYIGGVVARTGESRLAVLSNSSNGNGTLFPRPMVWARPTAASTVTWTRSRSGQPGAYWVQSVDFANVGG